MPHTCFNPESDHGSMFGFGKALWQLRRMIYGLTRTSENQLIDRRCLLLEPQSSVGGVHVEGG